MIKKTFKINTFLFTISYPDRIEIPANLKLFELLPGKSIIYNGIENTDTEGENNIETEAVQYSYDLTVVNTLPEIAGQIVAERSDMLVLHKDEARPDLEARYIGVKSSGEFYALYQETDERHARVYVKENVLGNLTTDVYFDSLLALERRMISQNAIILHSAYLKNKDYAILFSAPSGVGKSTQASLWEKYRGAKTMNGDRSLLTKDGNGIWTASGWPVCGSSEICNNVSLPIKAIVMLSQAPTNTIRNLSAFEAFRLVYEQVTANGWNSEFVELVMDRVMELTTEVPVYHLACTISEEAVSCLEHVI